MSFSIGASLPVGSFSSSNIDKINAGLAKNGFTIDLKYAHQFGEFFGFSTDFIYGRYSIKTVNNESANPISPWEYYELLIGPLLKGSIANNISLDLCVMTGTAFINATKVNMNGATLAKKYSSSAIPLNLQTNLHFYFKSKWYLVAGMSYNYMRTNFNVTVQSQDLSFKQSLNSISVNGGIGCIF